MDLSEMKRVGAQPAWSMEFGDRRINFQERTVIMGILNVTPDSFSDGGEYFDHDAAVKRGLAMIEEGADIIDIGGESTRPGAEEIDVSEEIARVIPVIRSLSEKTDAILSIDTRKSLVAKEAIMAGARLINDVSGFVYDPQIIQVALHARVPVVLMHSQGTPANMQKNPIYTNVIDEIYHFFGNQINFAIEKGLSREFIIVDPGIGFGKSVQHNYEILKNLSFFQSLGCPLLLGVSRKSFIGAVLNVDEKNRIFGTAAAVTASILNGAHIIRVHDIWEMKQVAQVTDIIKNTTTASGNP